MIFRRIVLLLFLFGLFAGREVFAGISRIKMTIDYTKVSGDLINFPVLITEVNMPAVFWANTTIDGSDIWCELADGTKLKRELVSIDTSAEAIELWVKLPSVSSSSDTVFYLNFGDSTLSETDDAEAWDSGYKTVIHGNDDDNKELFITIVGSKGGQGLTNDGTYFYWGEHVDDKIYKYLISAAAGSTPIDPVTSFAGPVHCVSAAFWTDNGTMIWAEYDTGGVTSESLWEITTAGVKGTTWDVSGIGEGVGVHITYKSGDNFYFSWVAADDSLNIMEVTLNANGTITQGDTWVSSNVLSAGHEILQGVVYDGTSLWILYDGSTTWLAKITLAAAPTITLIYNSYGRYASEPEGITILGDYFYWGDQPNHIFKSDLSYPYVGNAWFNKDSSGNDGFLQKISARRSIEVAGKIGRAQDYETSATAQSSSIDLFLSGVRPMADFTFEVWIYYEMIDTNARIYQDGEGAIKVEDVGGGDCQIAVYLGGAWRYSDNILISNMENNWRLLTVNLNNTTDVLSFYLDGVAIGTVGSMTASFGHVSNKIYIGSFSGSATYSIDARMDELRISNSVRGINWFLASYNNQSSPGTFYSAVVIVETFDQRLNRPLVSALRRSRYDF